jgi:hypothetical protein
MNMAGPTDGRAFCVDKQWTDGGVLKLTACRKRDMITVQDPESRADALNAPSVLAYRTGIAETPYGRLREFAFGVGFCIFG